MTKQESQNPSQKGWTRKQQRALNRIIDQYRDQPFSIIGVLQETQAVFGYLPQKAMEEISKALRIPPAQVFGVATFYAQFAFEPKGRHTILCCQGTACHVRGGAAIFEEIKRDLAVKEGETSEDGRFTLEKVYCVGCCSLAPAMIVDTTAYGKLAPGKTREILKRYK